MFNGECPQCDYRTTEPEDDRAYDIRPYKCGMVNDWTGGDEAVVKARKTIENFDGWLEHLMVWQVEEIIEDIAKAFRK